jgi:hypothetical protein
MQPLAICAVVVGAVMITGTLVTLIPTRRAIKPRWPGVNRWQLHGSIPSQELG